MAASQYSILRQYTPYVSPYNIDLIKDVTMYKQGKVDAAREKIYTQIDYLMGQEIDKAESRVYMEDKMANMIANINQKFKGVDLSSDGVTRAIQGEISSVLDDTVINAIAGTKEGRRMQKEISAIRQNHPELYSPINEWYAMSPYYEWLNDGNAGSRLGSLHYSPYIDYNKELNKAISDFRENNKGKKIQVQEYDSSGNPTGAITEISIDELSDAQIRNQVSANLSENMRNQMRIEASYMAATNPVFRNPQMVGTYLNSYLDRYDRQIGALEAKKKSVGDNKILLDSLNDKIQEAKNQKAVSRRDIDTILRTGDPVAAANFIVSNNLFDRMTDAWRYDNTSFERKKDDVYFAQQKEVRDQQKFLTDNAKTMADIALLNEQLAQAKIETKFMQTYGRKMGTKGSSGDGQGGVGAEGAFDGPAVTNAGTGAVDGVSLSNIPYEQMVSVSQERTANMLKLFNSLSEKDRNNIIAAADEDSRSNPGLYDGMSQEEKVYEYIRRNGGHKNGYMNQGNNNVSQAYDAITDSNAKMNSAVRAIDDISQMQTSNIVTAKNIAALDNVISQSEYLQSFIKSERDKGAFLLATAVASGKITPEKGWREYLTSAEGVSGIVGSMLPNIGVPISSAKITKGVIGALVGGDHGSSTSTLALINSMKSLLGDPDYNISDYVTVNKNGDIDIKEYAEGEPRSISYLRYLENNPTLADSLASNMAEDINMSIDTDMISDRLSHSYFNDSYLRYTWQKNAPQDSNMANQMRRLSAMMAGKIEGLNGTSINNIHMTSTVEDGKVRRFLTAEYGSGERSGITEPIEVTDDELIRNGFDPSSVQRNYSTDSYKSDFHICDFVDTGKEEGRSYDRFLVNRGLPGLASKADVKNDLYDDIKTFGSYLRPEDFNVVKTMADNFVDMSDNISVQLKGINDRGNRELIINFYDKNTVNSSDPILLFSDFIPLEGEGGEYADYYNNILEICPQSYYVKYVREAIQDRLDSMRDAYIRGVNIKPSNDKYSKLNDFLAKLYGSRQ